MPNFIEIVGFAKVVAWISLNCYMDLSKFTQGFVKVVAWIFLVVTWIYKKWYMDFFRLINGFVKIAKSICHSCSIYFLHFAKQKTKISKLVE